LPTGVKLPAVLSALAGNMEIATVAVYSEVDKQALHVAMADEAINIGGCSATESYLKIEAILAAVQKNRC